MNLAICMAGKNAVGDSYRDIMNNILCPEEYIVVIPEGYCEEEFFKNFNEIIYDKITHSKFRILKAIMFAFNIRKKIKCKKCKNVFLYFDNQWFVPMLYVFLLGLNVRILCWIHDPVLHNGANIKDRFVRYLNKTFLFKQVTRFIVSYNEGVDIMVHEYNIPHDKIECIYLPEMLSMEFSDIAQSDENIKYDFIFWGRIENYKGIERIINLARAMQDKTFLIIGRGKSEISIKNKCMDIKNISFLNEYVSDYNLAKYIKVSKYVLLPYIAATGSQTVSIANYYGKPVIASNAGCFKDYITNRVNGLKLLFDENENTIGIIKNLDDEFFDADIIRKFAVEKFSINNIVNSISKIM